MITLFSKIKRLYSDIKLLYQEEGKYFRCGEPTIADKIKFLIDVWVFIFQFATIVFIVGIPAWIMIAIWQLWLR